LEDNYSKVLIVEDHPDLAQNIISYLSNNNMECHHAAQQSDAENALRSHEYDVILLDVMLPDGSGLNLLEQINSLSSEPGVINDYLSKPFHLSELNARIKSLIRRKKSTSSATISFNGIEIDTDQHIVTINGELVEFTVKEQELLMYFFSNKKRVLTKQNIADYLWGDNVDFLDSFDFVYQHIKNIRKKINAAGGPDCIKTIYGLGYKLDDR